MNKIVCVDAHILIWGLKKQASKGQEKMIQKSEDFFEWADSEKISVLVPTIVIAKF